MLRDLVNWALKQADASPLFAARHCLAVRGGACRACAEACPHAAVTITRTVVVDPIDCTGCGLCVAACPSFALAPRGRAPAAAELRCSQVAGDAPSVVCLARLQASDLVRSAGGGASVTLARSRCGACEVGSSAVPATVERAAATARRLLAVHGRAPRFEVVERDRLEVAQDRRELSRRALLRGGWSGLRRSGGTLLAPLERFADPEPTPAGQPPLPAEHRSRVRVIELAAPAPTTNVPFRLPLVLDGCILCPACARACPTQAIRRVFDAAAASGSRLELDADRCIGCDACTEACPVEVVRMRDDVTWSEMHAPTRVLVGSAHRAGQPGAVARRSADAPSAADALDEESGDTS